MPDITMCANDKCSLSWNCWRFNAPKSIHQSMDSFSPDADGKCEMYLDMDERRAAMGESPKSTPKGNPAQQQDGCSYK